MPVPEAVGRANATAGLSVLFAGVTVVVAIAGLQVAGIPMLTTMGWGSAVMVAITMVAAVTLLPGLLGLVGRKVNSLRVPFVRPKPADALDTRSGRWAARVVARPVRYGVVAAVLLGVLAAPAFALRIGFADDGNEPPSSTMRKSYDLLADGFGPGFNGPFQVRQVDGSTDDEAALRDIGTRCRHRPGVASVSEPVIEPGRRPRRLRGHADDRRRQDAGTTELVDRLRDEVLPDCDARARRRGHGHRRHGLRGRHLRRGSSGRCCCSSAR